MNKAMKKLTYLLAAAAVFAACNSGNKGYTVSILFSALTHIIHKPTFAP